MTKNNIISYRDFRRQIEDGLISSWYVFSGDEDFLLEHALKLLEELLIAPGSESLDLIKVKQNFSIERVLEELRISPLLSERRLLIFYDSGLWNSKSGLAEEKQAGLKEIARLIHDQVCLCFVENKTDKRLKKNYSILKEAGGYHVEVNKENEETLRSWIAAYLGKKKIRISREAAESLILRCDSEMGQLSLELDKLSKYCEYAGLAQIDLALLDLACREDIQGNIFKLTDAISAKNISLALSYLDKLFKQKEPAILILFMLARHFRQLLAAKYASNKEGLATGLKVQNFVASRLLRQTEKFTLAELIHLSEACYKTDKAIKTGEIEERTALEIILFEAVKPLPLPYST